MVGKKMNRGVTDIGTPKINLFDLRGTFADFERYYERLGLTNRLKWTVGLMGAAILIVIVLHAMGYF